VPGFSESQGPILLERERAIGTHGVLWRYE
jgi:hypothetical protein